MKPFQALGTCACDYRLFDGWSTMGAQAAVRYYRGIQTASLVWSKQWTRRPT
jgi:hypothetical protein